LILYILHYFFITYLAKIVRRGIYRTEPISLIWARRARQKGQEKGSDRGKERRWEESRKLKAAVNRNWERKGKDSRMAIGREVGRKGRGGKGDLK
jgi:hypothetical protein